MNPFRDQELFMEKCDQTVNVLNPAQAILYHRLVIEEHAELDEAFMELSARLGMNEPDPELAEVPTVEIMASVIDGIADLIVTAIGLGHSLGVDLEESWAEVHRSNMSKVWTSTGKILRREDGKILKPRSFVPPNLTNVAQRALEARAA